MSLGVPAQVGLASNARGLNKMSPTDTQTEPDKG